MQWELSEEQELFTTSLREWLAELDLVDILGLDVRLHDQDVPVRDDLHDGFARRDDAARGVDR